MELQKLSRLMKLSWEIQRSRKSTRSQSLHAAWTILANEDVTVYYLVQRYSPHRVVTRGQMNQLALFTR